MLRVLMCDGSHSLLASIGLLLLRVVGALMLIMGHGLGKLENFDLVKEHFPAVLGLSSPTSLGLAVVGEFLCPILILIGFGTRLVAIPVIGTMMVAIFVFHANDPVFSVGNGASKELALMYVIPFIALPFTGAGMFSVDALIRGK